MKQKVSIRDMALGAVIMLIGLAVGVIVSPPLIAQRNEVFGEIQCTGLTVVDEAGNKAIDLSTDSEGCSIVVYDKEGRRGITLNVGGGLGNEVVICDKDTGAPVIALYAWELVNSIWLRKGRGRIELSVDDDEISQVATYGKSGGAYLKSGPLGSSAAVYCNNKGGIGLSALYYGNRITVNDGAGQIQWEAP